MKSGLPIDVHALLQGRVEALRLEYKSTWDRYCGSSALRTICAFANDLLNTNGGYVIFGVEEEDGVPRLPPRGLAVSDLERVKNELRGACNRIQPHYMPTIVPEQVGDRWVIVAWCPGGEGRPYEAPESLESGAPRRPYVREASSTREAKGELLRQLHEVAARVPFDDRACYDATSHDILPALVHEHLHEVRSRLAGERIEPDELYRKLNLLKRINGHEAPKNVALLFFSSEPRRWFRGARIEIAQFPEGKSGSQIIERNIEGPLPTMIRTALDYLRGLIPTEIRKVPDRAEALHIAAWPFAAVEEALINAVHHRGYDVPDPIKVYILPDALKIASYPGPVSGLSLKDLESGDPPPVPARNKRIAELLKDLQLAEARGTGIGKIRREMERNGSPPPSLRFDEDRTWFEVTLPIHPAFVRRETDSGAQPLRLGRPAPPEEVVGREETVNLVLRVLTRQGVQLVGPPGRGVSSLLGLVAQRCRERGALVFQLDLTGVTLRGLLAAMLDWMGQDPIAMATPPPSLAWDADRGAPRDLGRFLRDLPELLPESPICFVLDNIGSYSYESYSGNASPISMLQDLTGRRPNDRVIGASERASVATLSGTRLMFVPPLTPMDARTLALRLLRGSRLGEDTEVVGMLAEASAGLPSLMVAFVAEMSLHADGSVEGAIRAVDHVLHDRSDPARARARVARFVEQTFRVGRTRPNAPDQKVTRAILREIAGHPAGRRRLDLIASLVSAGLPRAGVLEALQELEGEGWVAELDGALRFEHPILRDAWLAHAEEP